MNNFQLKNNKLQHFLDISALQKSHLDEILDLASSFLTEKNGQKRIIANDNLKNLTVCNLFFENSTRTKTAFTIAAQKCGANVINLEVATSSTAKGESLIDTVHNLQATTVDILIVRHSVSGAVRFIAENLQNTIVINAGDGRANHPTQAMLDMLTIQQYKQTFTNLKVAIIGDILHSRVARSDLQALQILGCKDISLIAPKTLLPNNFSEMGVQVINDYARVNLKDFDVVITLRLQLERMQAALLPSLDEFFQTFGLQKNIENSIIMHPGPINRNVEIASEVADSENSLILNQVTNGVAVRMAIMQILAKNRNLF